MSLVEYFNCTNIIKEQSEPLTFVRYYIKGSFVKKRKTQNDLDGSYMNRIE